MRRLLILDDDPMLVSALQASLGVMFPDGVSIEAFTSPEQALARVHESPFDVVVSDYRMPVMNGIEFLRLACRVQPHLVRLMLSSTSDFEVVQQAINEVEVYRYLAKPWVDADLYRHIQDACIHAENMARERALADSMRVQAGALYASECDLPHHEDHEPGLTVVEWGVNDGEPIPDPTRLI